MNKRLRLFLLLGAICGLCSCAFERVDTILVNGIIHTMSPNDKIVQSIAIEDGKIVAIGNTEDILRDYAAGQIIDLEGNVVFPGFIDAHCHAFSLAAMLDEVQLVGTDSFEEVLQQVDAWAAMHPSGWIIGRGWDQNDWTDKQFPTNEQLNIRYPDRPVFLVRVDGHAALANEAALKLAGIQLGTKIPGGVVELTSGRLTGILLDNAVERVQSVIPQPSHQIWTNRIARVEDTLLSYGITTIDEAGVTPRQLDLLDSLRQNNLLNVRWYAMIIASDSSISTYAECGPVIHDMLDVSSFKILGDGALGSRGACLLQPYADRKETQGFFLESPETYRKWISLLYKAGFQVNAHCIGDSANRFFLREYANVLKGLNDRRWRIEHAQVIHPDDFHRFGNYGIIPSVQPTHATSDMYWAETRLGTTRLQGAYAYKTMLETAHILALGTDCPVEKVNPINTFYAAVFREDHYGYPLHGFLPTQKLTREEAIRGMTIWAAYANHQERSRGSIEPGKYADFVVLDTDIMFAEKKEILVTRVMRTFLNGKLVFSR